MFTIKTEDSDETELFPIKTENSDETEMFTIKTEDFDETDMVTIKTETDHFDETVVALDTYNSDLNLVIDASCFSAKPLTTEGFAFMWAGARATHGASRGKFCFEVKILANLNVKHLPTDEPDPHIVRVGFSVESSAMQLGEDGLSFGYDGTGNIFTNCQFQGFGEPFAAGDVVLGAVNADSEQVQIGFSKNGKFLGWAFQVRENELKGLSLFPHILTKNVSFEVNMGQKDQPFFPLPDLLKDFTFIGCLPASQREVGTRPPNRKEDCEVLMMCGLPWSGKSVWVAEYSAKNPKKKYNVWGLSHIRAKMKVMGLPHQRIPNKKVRECLMKMEEIGSELKRNYIFDDDHISPKRCVKLHRFEGFRRKAVVVLPSEAEYQRRIQRRNEDNQRKASEEGRKVYKSGNMGKKFLPFIKAQFKLPEVSDIFDEVIYTDLQKEDAEQLIIQYRKTPKMKNKSKKRKGRGGFCNESDCSNANFSNIHPVGHDGSRGRKRKFDDGPEGASFLSLSVARDKCKYVESVGNPFRRDSRAGRYFNSKMGGFHGSSNSSREWYGGNIFNQDSSHGHGDASGFQGEYSGGASQRSFKKEPDWP